MILIEIPGDPIPATAPRLGRGGRVYNSRSKENERIKWQMRAQYNREAPIAGPVRLIATFYMPIPKATSGIRRRQMLAGLIHHIKRPDSSNLAYGYENCLKGIVIEDDSQVVEFTAKKVYGERPKTVLQIDIIDQKE